jgi:hypothetical protein
MVTTRQGQSTNTRSKASVVVNKQHEVLPTKEKYLRTGKVINKANRENIQNNAHYERQEYAQVLENEDDETEEDENTEYYDDAEAAVCMVQGNYNYGSKEKEETQCGETELHVQMNKVINDLNEEKTLARKTYNNFCQKIGTMDNHNVLQETVRRTTRKQAWKNFKLLEDEDYHYNSTFALFMFESLGIDVDTITGGDGQRQELWLKFKKYVSEGMQAARSSATQSIKKQFIGKKIVK